MSDRDPMVSICMLAYNLEPFVGKAIEGVLQQDVNFPIELVIGEDCSRDGTRVVCENYAALHPDRIRLLPSGVNLGMPGNAARTLAECRGKYIAICDGDDIWTDPTKLRQQIEFLEKNPDYGIVYTDVTTISETDTPIVDPDHMRLRKDYADGMVFFNLMGGNFLNNSTTVFRRRFLAEYPIDPERGYYNYDHLLWLRISAQANVHFINTPTTAYRRHSGAASTTAAPPPLNRRKAQYYLYDILTNFDTYYHNPLKPAERMLIFKKILSVLYRKENTLRMKIGILRLLPKYFPGIRGFAGLFFRKMGLQQPHPIHDNALTTNLD